MTLKDKLKDDMKSALKAKETQRLGTIRLMLAAIQAKENELSPGVTLNDADLIGILRRLLKQREESTSAFEKGGRPELAAAEREEASIIALYLPKQMSPDAARIAIKTVIADLGVTSPKDMGRVMAALKERHQGEMDFGLASALVKDLLAG